MQKVFISYSSGDSDFAELLLEKLNQRGIEAWLDQAALHPGDDWEKSIEENIAKSDTLILVLSPRSAVSTYVTFEWAYALGNGANVIPVLLEATEKHPRLESIHYLDFTNPRTRPWEKLFSAITFRKRGALDIFLEHWPNSYKGDFENCEELWMIGVSLSKTVKRFGPILEQKLKNGHKMNVLVAEPSPSVVEAAVRRTSNEQEIQADIEEKHSEIKGTIRRLLNLNHKYGETNQLLIRKTKYPLGYGIHGMDPMGPNGVLYVKLYPYKAEELEKPRFVLRRGRDRWYESFARELHALWNDGQLLSNLDLESLQ